jgi:MFS family permease
MDTVKKLALALALLSYFVVALDGSIVFTGLEKISADLSLSQTSLSWFQNAYVFAFGGFMLMGGKIGDVFGRNTAINLSFATSKKSPKNRFLTISDSRFLLSLLSSTI